MVPEGEFPVDRLGHHIHTMVTHWCQMNAAEAHEEGQISVTPQYHAFYPLKWKMCRYVHSLGCMYNSFGKNTLVRTGKEQMI